MVELALIVSGSSNVKEVYQIIFLSNLNINVSPQVLNVFIFHLHYLTIIVIIIIVIIIIIIIISIIIISIIIIKCVISENAIKVLPQCDDVAMLPFLFLVCTCLCCHLGCKTSIISTTTTIIISSITILINATNLHHYHFLHYLHQMRRRHS